MSGNSYNLQPTTYNLIFHWYGLMIGIGVWVGSLVATKAQQHLKRFRPIYGNFSVDTVIMWGFIPGLVGARLYHVIDLWEYYSQHLEKIPAVWEGGLAIYGGLLGGLIGIGSYVWLHFPASHNRWSFFMAILDCLAVGVPIAQAIGRLGNYFNQELFGLPTSLPWGIFIDSTNRPAAYIEFTRFHPLFFYESLASLLLAWWLWRQLKTAKSTGWWFFWYLVGYGLIRFSLDFLRIDPWRLGWFTTAQWVSLVFIGLGSLSIVKRKQTPA